MGGPEVEGIRESLRTADVPGVLLDLPVGYDALRALWDAHEDVAWRRTLLGAALVKITVAPAVRGRSFFDPQRIDYDWRI